MRMCRIATAVLAVMFVGITDAFHLSLPHTTRQVTPATLAPVAVAKITTKSTTTTARYVILTEAELDRIVKSATDCSDGECSVDDVSDLIEVLKDQQAVLEDRMEKVMNMIADLQQLNEKEERQTEDVRGMVRDMLRVFSNEKPFAPATGFSGDVGDGPKTAWDALPPKKWKPTDTK